MSDAAECLAVRAFADGFRLGRDAGPVDIGLLEPASVPTDPETVGELQRQLADLERKLIQRAYDEGGGVKTEVARLLGIKTSALYYKLEKYGLGIIEKRRKDIP